MKKHLLLFALLLGFAGSAHAQYGPRTDRSERGNPGRGGYNPVPTPWTPDNGNRRGRCNGNCACGGRPSYYEAMPDADFAAAMQQLKDQSFDADRLRTARYIASTSYLSTRQVVTMANQFSFSGSKKDFLIAAYPATLDKNMYFQAVNTLSFSKDREEVWNAVENMR